MAKTGSRLLLITKQLSYHALPALETYSLLMKWILLTAILLTPLSLFAAEQYSKAECDNLKHQKEQIRKRMNQGYGVAEGNWLNKRDRELFRLIGLHCSSPNEDRASTTTERVDMSPSVSRNSRPSTSLQDMPNWSANNDIFKDDKAAAWSEYYQVPVRCRQKALSEIDFVQCADHKAEQRKQFDEMWQLLKFTPLTTGVSSASASTFFTPRLQTQPHVESMQIYTIDDTADMPDVNAAKTVTVDKDFHKHFSWFGIAFVIFIAGSSWIIWRK
ncbi:hypothetical protein [Rheinheimera baltica]|uniref:hypothetical protein n=1 Tax=Rheinheimera baltica TaxID=67576 RepID=UPI00273D1414|nr:hypothetical protein [Rheinheimera baltica]MDP5151639.1 hypothetical protein [Rheinheimera baltica]